MKRNKILTYSELIKIDSFEDRIEYLRLGAIIGASTFGSQRFINQAFYRSPTWKRIRNKIIVRDNACDLAHPDHQLYDGIFIHHLNPITEDDIIEGTEFLLDPEFLITTCDFTHKLIHYGNDSSMPKKYIPRAPNDTKLW